MLALQCPAQNYAWGRPADKSEVKSPADHTAGGSPIRDVRWIRKGHLVNRHPLAPQVAKLAKSNGVAIDESKPFAELWWAPIGRMHGVRPGRCGVPAARAARRVAWGGHAARGGRLRVVICHTAGKGMGMQPVRPHRAAGTRGCRAAARMLRHCAARAVRNRRPRATLTPPPGWAPTPAAPR